eukprot:scaffold6174_cov125-Isochrysis_galbana.AAC.20
MRPLLLSASSTTNCPTRPLVAAGQLIDSESWPSVSSCGVRGGGVRDRGVLAALAGRDGTTMAASSMPPAGGGKLLIWSASWVWSHALISLGATSTPCDSANGSGRRNPGSYSQTGCSAAAMAGRSSRTSPAPTGWPPAMHTASTSSEKADEPPAALKAQTRKPYSHPTRSRAVHHVPRGTRAFPREIERAAGRAGAHQAMRQPRERGRTELGALSAGARGGRGADCVLAVWIKRAEGVPERGDNSHVDRLHRAAGAHMLISKLQVSWRQGGHVPTHLELRR